MRDFYKEVSQFYWFPKTTRCGGITHRQKPFVSLYNKNGSSENEPFYYALNQTIKRTFSLRQSSFQRALKL